MSFPKTSMPFTMTGFLNAEPEIKRFQSGKEYMYLNLGQGKDDQGNFKPSLRVVAYGNIARLIAAECKKGDLIALTKIGFSNQTATVQKADNSTFEMNYVMPAILEYQKIDYRNNAQQNQQQQAAPQQAQPNMPPAPPMEAYEQVPQQQAPQAAPGMDDFDDDIPF